MTISANNRHESQTLSEQQILAAGMVATGKSGREVSAILEVGESTVSRWRQMPVFQSYVNGLLKEHEESVRNRLRALSDKALTTIENVMASPKASPADQLRAALAVLDKVSGHEVGSTNAAVIAREQTLKAVGEALILDDWDEDQ